MIARYFLCFFAAFCIKETLEHGMMMEPPNRSSLWRFDNSSPINYNDNENFCGGYAVQHLENGGKCGVCGDNYVDPHPQKNENTGEYGRGKVVREYKAGSVIDTRITLTANHIGTFHYSICKLEDPNAPESGEDCFQALTLEDGSPYFNVDDKIMKFNNRVKLPEALTCDRCVFRWHYRAGNTWGNCKNGTHGPGCGPQETFRSCADVRIV